MNPDIVSLFRLLSIMVHKRVSLPTRRASLSSRPRRLCLIRTVDLNSTHTIQVFVAPKTKRSSMPTFSLKKFSKASVDSSGTSAVNRPLSDILCGDLNTIYPTRTSSYTTRINTVRQEAPVTCPTRTSSYTTRSNTVRQEAPGKSSLCSIIPVRSYSFKGTSFGISNKSVRTRSYTAARDSPIHRLFREVCL